MQESLLSRLSDVLDTRLGLHFPPTRWGDLARGLAAAAPLLGAMDTESCARRLLSAPFTRRERDILAACLTVGETYFFRDRAGFEALERRILPELLQARQHDERRLRLWSAGCCTGEEPYSLAMLLDRLVPGGETRDVTLLATDINPQFLGKAAEGVYGEWSFRDMPDWARERYFRRIGAGRHEIDPRIRSRVQFSCLSLADDGQASCAGEFEAMDLILCRNVLMYFTPARAKMVVDRLHRALADGGWLAVGPAEACSPLFSAFTAVDLDGAVFYRKPAPRRERRMRSPAAVPPVAPRQAAARQPQHAPPPTTEQHDDTAAPPADGAAPGCLARTCADEGRFDEAVAWCEQAIAADRLDPAHPYLLGTILQERGQTDAAAQWFDRALYLDPDFVLAHFALGNLRLSQERLRPAQRHFANALALAQAQAPDAALPEGAGLTAGHLVQIIAAVQASLPPIGGNSQPAQRRGRPHET